MKPKIRLLSKSQVTCTQILNSKEINEETLDYMSTNLSQSEWCARRLTTESMGK